MKLNGIHWKKWKKEGCSVYKYVFCICYMINSNFSPKHHSNASKSISVLSNLKPACLSHLKKKVKSYVLSAGSWKAHLLGVGSRTEETVAEDCKLHHFLPRFKYFPRIWAALDTIKVIKTYQTWARVRSRVFILEVFKKFRSLSAGNVE